MLEDYEKMVESLIAKIDTQFERTRNVIEEDRTEMLEYLEDQHAKVNFHLCVSKDCKLEDEFTVNLHKKDPYFFKAEKTIMSPIQTECKVTITGKITVDW